MRFLIRGANFVNKGAEAMLRTVQSELGNRFEGSTFLIDRTSIVGGTEELVNGAGLKHLKRPINPIAGGISFARLTLGAPRQAKTWLREVGYLTGWKKGMESVDAIIDISGYAYADTFGVRNALRTATIIEQAQRSKVPYIFLPQAWGPFGTDRQLHALLRKMYDKSTLFYSRDQQSRQFLADLFHKPVDDIQLSPDIAFLFNSSGRDTGQRLIHDLGLTTNRPIVGIAPNMRVYERSEGFGASNSYLKVMTDISRFFLEHGAAILLVPHEILAASNSQMDDRMLCELIRLKLGDRNDVVAVTSSMSAEDIKAMIAGCEFLVGSRFHALIAALQSRVPAVAIGWSHKYEELMGDVHLEKNVFDYADPLLNINDFLESSWAKRGELKRILEDRIPFIENAVAQMFNYVEHTVSK